MSSLKTAKGLLIGCAFATIPLVARAQDTSLPDEVSAVESCGEAAASSCSAAPRLEPTAPLLWTLTASAGVTTRKDGPNGSYQALALTRNVGGGYLRAGVMRYHGTLLQADTALPSDYFIGTIATGGNFNNWVVDAWASYGRQDYGKISTSAGERPSTGAAGSDYYAVGGDFGRVVTLAPDWYMTPTVVGSYAAGKLLRPAPIGLTDLETDEPTWSANAAVRIDHAFGARRSHYVGLSISRNWTSNAVSQVRPPSDPGSMTAPTALTSEHFADFWFEAGATANIQLARGLGLDIYATRSFDALAGNAVSTGLSLRKSF